MTLPKKSLCSLVTKSESKPVEPLYWLDVDYQWAKLPDVSSLVGWRKSAEIQCCPNCHAKLYFGVVKPS